MTPGKLALAAWRDLCRHRGQAALSVLGVALGVAVLVAVDLANESARRAFALSMESLTGRATHQLRAADGRLSDQQFVELRRAGLRPSAPVVQGVVRIDGEAFHLIGVDPFSDGEFRAAVDVLAEGDLRALLTGANAVSLSAADLDRLGLAVGDPITLQAAGQQHPAVVVARIDSANPAALEGLMFADIATAQEVLDRVGWLDRIDLILDDAAAAAWRDRLPPGVRLEPVRGDHAAQRQMTAAFHTNLAAMGLLALLVGVLLVYNTMTFSVLRRRGLLGMMRVLGATRGNLFALVVAESLVVGVVGTVLGLSLGVLLGQGLVKLVTRTINDLYFVLTVSSLLVSPAVLWKGAAVGMLATVAASLGPAVEAARTVPQAALRRSGIERRSHALTPWLALFGVLLIAVGLLLVNAPGDRLDIAFGALFLCVLGFALTVPAALLVLIRLLGPLSQRLFGRNGRLATRGIGAGLSRSGIAVAALTVAVAATVGVGIMVESFRATVQTWLGQTLTSDIYVSLPDASADIERRRLAPTLLAALERLDGVESVSTSRVREVDGSLGPVLLLALGEAPQVEPGFRFIASESAASVWPRYRRGEAVLISEALAFHHGLAVGDRVVLRAVAGEQAFDVAGIYVDYSTDRGMISIDRATYARLWRDPGVSTAGLRLATDADRGAVLAQVRAMAADSGQPVSVRANAEIRALSLAVFDRTFAITGVLRMLVVGVAFIGILSALTALQLERAREHATLRALGVTPRQLAGLMSIECGVMGLIAGILALPLGWLMSDLLIDVINRRSFGWSMQSLLPADVLSEAVVLAVVAALLAGIYPAWRIAAAPPADALREE